MSAAVDWLVDAYDWSVDGIRAALGFPPLPPQLVKLEFDQQPKVRVVGALRMQTRRAFHSSLLIEQDGVAVFEGPPPRNGRIGVMPLTGSIMRVQTKLEARNPAARHGMTVTEAIFEPLPNGPAVEQFEAPAKVAFGEAIAVAWHAPTAQRAHLAMIENGNVEDSVGSPNGQMLVHPTRPGRVLLRLTAESSWGQTTVTRHVIVVPPQLRITLPLGATIAGHPGDTARFEWRVSGAESVWLVTPDAEQARQVDPDSALIVTLGWRPAEFHLIARGYGGTERSVVLRTVPQPFACLEE
jgi:hypothetical protein